LLIASSVWLTLAERLSEDGSVECVLPRIEAVLRFASELDEQLAAAGVGGIVGALELSRRVRELLASIDRAELEAARATVTRLEEVLGEVAGTLARVRRLKELVPP
jgi:hypothetical protein